MALVCEMVMCYPITTSPAPSLTRSPSFTRASLTVPSAGALIRRFAHTRYCPRCGCGRNRGGPGISRTPGWRFAPADTRDCSLVLGSVSGRAPFGTQSGKVLTTGGLEKVPAIDRWYEVPSVRVLCSEGPLQMTEMRFEGREAPYTPVGLVSRLDLR